MLPPFKKSYHLANFAAIKIISDLETPKVSIEGAKI